MQRLDSAAKAWLGALALATIAILGVGSYAALHFIRDTSRAREAQDTRSPDEAYRDLWAALEQRDGAEASKYVPAVKLQAMKSADDVVSSFLVLSPVSDLRVVRSTTTGDKAVLVVRPARRTSPTTREGRRRSTWSCAWPARTATGRCCPRCGWSPRHPRRSSTRR